MIHTAATSIMMTIIGIKFIIVTIPRMIVIGIGSFAICFHSDYDPKGAVYFDIRANFFR